MTTPYTVLLPVELTGRVELFLVNQAAAPGVIAEWRRTRDRLLYNVVVTTGSIMADLRTEPRPCFLCEREVRAVDSDRAPAAVGFVASAELDDEGGVAGLVVCQPCGRLAGEKLGEIVSNRVFEVAPGVTNVKLGHMQADPTDTA